MILWRLEAGQSLCSGRSLIKKNGDASDFLKNICVSSWALSCFSVTLMPVVCLHSLWVWLYFDMYFEDLEQTDSGISEALIIFFQLTMKTEIWENKIQNILTVISSPASVLLSTSTPYNWKLLALKTTGLFPVCLLVMCFCFNLLKWVPYCTVSSTGYLRRCILHLLYPVGF